jgi:predicted P-loop ATPase
VREWLDSLVWDGIPRLHTWMIDYLGAKDTLYVRAVSAAWPISGVARAMQPGCKADHVLLLEGHQGLRKSSALKALMPDESFFSDEISNLGSKDSAQDLRGKWLIEISELSAMKGAGIEKVKAFISRSTDHYRPSYGRRSQDFPRQCFFAATTNSITYLDDETGNRRFWPVNIHHVVLDELKANRDQLWAEAVHRYHAGEYWWLPKKLEEMAHEEQADRRIVDPWEDIVLSWAFEKIEGQAKADQDLTEAKDSSDAHTEYGRLRISRCEQAREEVAVTITGALEHIGVKRDKQDQAASNRVARILRAAGWERYRARYGSKRPWEYRKHVLGPSGPS